MTIDIQSLLKALRALWLLPASVNQALFPANRTSLVMDSRQLNAGDVFIAVPGACQDGRAYVDAALKAGASLVLRHGEPDEPVSSFEGRVLSLRGLGDSLGELGRLVFRVPDDLQVMAVTGTNGKSSVVHFVAELSECLGTPCGVIGTLGAGRLDNYQDHGLTTPGPLALQAALAGMAAKGVKRVAMEASSHALDQNRLAATRVSAALFTNLTRDHLDYHGSMSAYAAAKARLFQRPELALAVVNADDPLARLMLSGIHPAVRVLASGVDEAVTLRVLEYQPSALGLEAMMATPEGERHLTANILGRFNLDNLMLSMTALYGLGHGLDDLLTAASRIKPVPGRMELHHGINAPAVVVDYAHTPDALTKALVALKSHLGENGRLWCVFGCGGERDPGKRALMAKAAQLHADQVIVTDDNPRGESALAIRQAIMAGFKTLEGVVEKADRALAIKHAIRSAASCDLVLVAGKGHETYQDVMGVRHDFNDSHVVKAALNDAGGQPC